jgi:uncharacterized protein YndB with AHSA1/START domain
MNDIPQMAGVDQIVWPAHYDPKHCPVHVRNELTMDVAPENVWAWLIRAQLWPTWYANSSNVRFLSGAPPDLALGTRFSWKTFGVSVQSTVLELVPGERIAWDGHGFGLDVYHAWLIRKTDKGCHVLTEESQHGWVARLGSLLMPKRMWRMHQLWLEELRAHAATGGPPRE